MTMKTVKKKLCMALMLLLFILIPVSNVYAEETTKIEPIKGESFAEYTERLMRAEAEAAGMTYEEYMQMKTNDIKNTQVITEVEKPKNTEYKIDISKVAMSFVATAIIYTIVPVAYRLYHNAAVEKKKAFKIALTNSIIIGLIFAIITINKGEEWNVSPCVLYFFINELILSYKGKEQE